MANADKTMNISPPFNLEHIGLAPIMTGPAPPLPKSGPSQKRLGNQRPRGFVESPENSAETVVSVTLSTATALSESFTQEIPDEQQSGQKAFHSSTAKYNGPVLENQQITIDVESLKQLIANEVSSSVRKALAILSPPRDSIDFTRTLENPTGRYIKRTKNRHTSSSFRPTPAVLSFTNQVFDKSGQLNRRSSQSVPDLLECCGQDEVTIEETAHEVSSNSQGYGLVPSPEVKHRDNTSRWHRGHKRECLARAMQMNVTKIVDALMYLEGDITDVMISEKCMTEDECSSIRQRDTNRRDQIRIVLSCLHGRDLSALQKFHEYVRTVRPDVAESVQETYDNLLRKRPTTKLCAFCRLKIGVDIKVFVEALWGFDIISFILYQKIIYARKPQGDQDKLWNQASQECKDRCSTRELLKEIIHCLNTKGHYVHIVCLLEHDLKNGHPFECLCKAMNPDERVISGNSTASSAQPRSSSGTEYRSSNDSNIDED